MSHHDEVDVLVVDDAAGVAEAMACALELNGYTVRIASDGAEALSMIETRRPHCVLLDIDMPGIDGLELTTRLRERHGDDIVLIAVTGWADDDPRVAETFARVDHHLKKPVDSALIRKLLPPIVR